MQVSITPKIHHETRSTPEDRKREQQLMRERRERRLVERRERYARGQNVPVLEETDPIIAARDWFRNNTNNAKLRYKAQVIEGNANEGEELEAPEDAQEQLSLPVPADMGVAAPPMRLVASEGEEYRQPPSAIVDKEIKGKEYPFARLDRQGLVAPCGCRDWETLFNMYHQFLLISEIKSRVVLDRSGSRNSVFGAKPCRFYVAALLVYGLTGSADPSGAMYLQDIPAYINPHLQYNALRFIRRCIARCTYVWPVWPDDDPWQVDTFIQDYKYGEHYASFLWITNNMNERHLGKVVHPNSHGKGIHPQMHQYYNAINCFWETVEADPPHDWNAAPWREPEAEYSE